MGRSFHLLGPLRAAIADADVTPTAAKERNLLALLLVQAGQPVSADRLLDELWPDVAPDRARRSLHVRVASLRKVFLQAGDPNLLQSTAAGYVLALDADEIDVQRFAALVRQGRDRRDGGDPEGAARSLQAGLDLWRGDALADAHDSVFLEQEAARLGDAYADALEDWADVALACGRQDDVLGELNGRAEAHPYRERLCRLHVLGLYLAGRQPDALAVAAAFRRRLVDDLGLDASPLLLELERAILDHAVVVAPSRDRAGPAAAPLGHAPWSATALPVFATTFVGRDRDVERIKAELMQHPLLTLTGPGGVGKTRLALEVARSAGSSFADGVCFLDLTPSRDVSVLHAIAAAVGVQGQAGMTMGEVIVDALRGRTLLLVVDNCEHVLEAVAELVSQIVQWCPGSTILATSREPLGVVGERTRTVAPLGTSAGVELFVERAGRADVELPGGTGDRGLVREICDALDGIPLAIQLAAARVRSMTLLELAGRLHDRFELLQGGRRAGPAHHRTLTAAVQWSYELLTDEERFLFDRLSVFVGGFDAEAAAAVVGSTTARAEDRLGGLVAKSMVVADRSGRRTGFRLLESLRQFGEQRLEDARATNDVRARHLAHYLSTVERGRGQFEGADHAGGARTLKAEWDNLRAAFTFAVESEDRPAVRRFLRSLLFFAWMDARHELEGWAQLATEHGLGDTLTNGVAGFFALQRGGHDDAQRLARHGLELSTDGGADDWICWCALTFACWGAGRTEEGLEADHQLCASVDAGGDPYAAACAELIAGGHAVYLDVAAAREHLGRARRLAAAAPSRLGDVPIQITWMEGLIARVEGRTDEARQQLLEVLHEAERAETRFMIGYARLELAITAVAARSPRAEVVLSEAIVELWRVRNRHTFTAIEIASVLLVRRGRYEPAGVILGHLMHVGVGHASHSRSRQWALEKLSGSTEATEALAIGARLERDELVDYTLAALRESALAVDAVPGPAAPPATAAGRSLRSGRPRSS